jgi:putative membrane protein
MTEYKTAQRFESAQFKTEREALTDLPSTPELQASQTFEDSKFLPVAPLEDSELTLAAVPAKSWSIGFKLFAGLTATYAVVEWGMWLWQSVQQHWLVGGLAVSISVLAVGLLGRFAWRLRGNRRQLNLRQLLRERWLGCDNKTDASDIAEQAAMQLQLAHHWSLHKIACPDHLNGPELLTWFEGQLLEPIDRQVAALSRQATLQTGVAVALSPFALADMLIVAWRGQALIGQIAQAYGAEPDVWLRGALLKQHVQNVVLAGSAEMLSDVASDFLNAELAGKVSARAGQGVLAGALMLRLARSACIQFRPAPVTVSIKANSRQILTELLQRLRSPAN